jgi:hypothetical protein
MQVAVKTRTVQPATMGDIGARLPFLPGYRSRCGRCVVVTKERAENGGRWDDGT